MHAEATSEKLAMGWFLDGRVSAVWGTHTHVQTSDARVLPRGTGYISDLGMTGRDANRCSASTPEQSIRKFLGDPAAPVPQQAKGPGKLEGCGLRPSTPRSAHARAVGSDPHNANDPDASMRLICISIPPFNRS